MGKRTPEGGERSMANTLDYAEVSKLRQHLAQQWNSAHAQWRQWHDIHDQHHKIRYAAPANVRKLGIARAKIAAMVDTLVTTQPTVTRAVVAAGKVHDDLADKAKNWGKALLLHTAVSGAVTPPFRSAAVYLALIGYAAGVVRWDDKAWDVPMPEKGRGYQKRLDLYKREQRRRFPFVIEFPHPARILLPHTESRPTVGIEIASMYGWQVEEMLRAQDLPTDDLHAKPYDAVEVLNYWDEQKRGLFINKQEVEVRDNALGRVPFVHGFSGYGHEGIPSGDMSVTMPTGVMGAAGPKPEDLAVGLLAGVVDSIRALDEFMTAVGYLVQTAAYPTYFTSENAEELARKMEEAGIGGIVQVGDPQNALKPSEIPQMGAWMAGHAAMLRQDIEEGTASGSVQGQLSPNVPTATGQAMQLGQARLRFGMPMHHLNLMAAEAVGLCARMTAERGETVTIDEYACGADDFEGSYDFTVDFMADDEGELLRKKNLGMEEYEKKLLDFDSYQEDVAGRPDSSVIRRKINLDTAMASPEIQGAIIQAATALFQMKLAQRNQGGGSGNGRNPAPAPPAGFTTMPGGPQEAAQAQQGMEQVPGEGIARVVPNG